MARVTGIYAIAESDELIELVLVKDEKYHERCIVLPDDDAKKLADDIYAILNDSREDDRFESLGESYLRVVEKYEQLQATADRRLELLRDILDFLNYAPFEFSNGIIAPNGMDEGDIQGTNALIAITKKIEKELSDEDKD